MEGSKGLEKAIVTSRGDLFDGLDTKQGGELTARLAGLFHAHFHRSGFEFL